jgi:hypothetical protein
MAPIDDAIAAYDAQESGEKVSYRQVAKKIWCERDHAAPQTAGQSAL